MTIERAIDILTPGKVRYNTREYCDALALARAALFDMQERGYCIEIVEIARKEEAAK